MNGPPRPVTVLFVVEGGPAGGRLHLHDCLQGRHRMSERRWAWTTARDASRWRCSVLAWPRSRLAAQAARRPAARTGGGERADRDHRGRAGAGAEPAASPSSPAMSTPSRARRLRTDQLRVFYAGEEERRPPAASRRCRRIEAEGNVIITQPGEVADGQQRGLRPRRRQDGADRQRRAHPRQERGPGRPARRTTATRACRRFVHRKPGGEQGERVRALFVPEPSRQPSARP